MSDQQPKAIFIGLQNEYTLIFRTGDTWTQRRGDCTLDAKCIRTVDGRVRLLTAVWCVIGGRNVLIDWPRVPAARLGEFPVDAVRAEYVQRTGACSIGDITIGNAVLTAHMLPEAAKVRVLPNGWRVIDGGAA